MVSGSFIGKSGGAQADELATTGNASKSRSMPAPTDAASPDESRGFLSRWSERKRSDSVRTQVGADRSDAHDSDGGLAEGDLTDSDVIASDLATSDLTSNDLTETDLPGNESGAESGAECDWVLLEGEDAVTDSPLAVDEADDPTQSLLTDLDMPDVGTLDASSDFSPFMNEGVSKELRQKALRHLFRLPKFNVRDGLNDYDEDYTYFEPLGDTVTCDMKFHIARKERERLEKLEQERLELEQGQAQTENEAHAESEQQAEPEQADPEQAEDELTRDELAQDELAQDELAQDELDSDSNDGILASSDEPADEHLPDNDHEPAPGVIGLQSGAAVTADELSDECRSSEKTLSDKTLSDKYEAENGEPAECVEESADPMAAPLTGALEKPAVLS